jgi:hypothetical protein
MTEHEHAFAKTQLVYLSRQRLSCMSLAAGNDQPGQGIFIAYSCERLDQVGVAFLELLASHREDDLMFGQQTQRFSHNHPTVVTSVTQPFGIASPPDDCDSVGGNSEVFHGRIFDGLTDCMKVVGEMPGCEAVEQLGDFEPHGRDIGVACSSFVIGGVHQVGHHGDRQTGGGQTACDVRVVKRGIHKIGSLINNHTPKSQSLSQQGSSTHEPDVMSRLQHFLFEADCPSMKTADDRGNLSALEFWKQLDQRALGSSCQKRVDDEEVLRALCSLSDSALA